MPGSVLRAKVLVDGRRAFVHTAKVRLIQTDTTKKQTRSVGQQNGISGNRGSQRKSGHQTSDIASAGCTKRQLRSTEPPLTLIKRGGAEMAAVIAHRGEGINSGAGARRRRCSGDFNPTPIKHGMRWYPTDAVTQGEQANNHVGRR